MTGVVAARGWVGGAGSRVALPVWPIAFFPVWDLYIAGIRPLDHLGVLALFLAAFYQRDSRIEADNVWKFLLIGCLFLWMLFTGGLQQPEMLKPAIAIIEGIAVGLCISASGWSAAEVIRFLRLLIIVHVGALYFQALVYFGSGYELNYLAWAGAELRTGTGLGMRPAGLFLEPAGYCLFMFSLLSLFRLLGGSAARLEATALLSMAITLSLWGSAAALVYILLFRRKAALIIIPVVVAGVAYAAVTINAADFNKNIVTFHILRRILNPSEDGSSQSRYGGLFSIDLERLSTWIGHGITNDYQDYGANGLSFLLSSGGLVGLSFIVALWFLAMPTGRRLRGTIALTFMLSAASQWTFMWWWVWLALAACTDSDICQSVSRLRKRDSGSINVNA